MRLVTLLSFALLAACSNSPEPPLAASDLIITRPPPGMTMSAAYMSLTNNTDQAIRISKVASDQYESVQLHESTIEDGVARMRAIGALEIPAGETVTLERGGKHLMLMRPTQRGDTVSLRFLDGDDVLLVVTTAFGTGAD